MNDQKPGTEKTETQRIDPNKNTPAEKTEQERKAEQDRLAKQPDAKNRGSESR